MAAADPIQAKDAGGGCASGPPFRLVISVAAPLQAWRLHLRTPFRSRISVAAVPADTHSGKG